MIEHPGIPMSPSQLPQQRLVEVVDLPDRPETFEPVICYGYNPEQILPKRRPRTLLFLGAAEWAWSPMHSRIEAYYLHRGRAHWITYHRDLASCDAEYTWTTGAYVYRRGIDLRQAAVHLMIARWRYEAENGLDAFHSLTREGFLSVADWRAIAREVWG